MDLQELVFKVNTDELKSAVQELGKLGDKVASLKGDVQGLTKVSKELEKTPIVNPPKSDGIEKSISAPVKKARKNVEDLKEELRITQKDLAEGFTRGESSILKVARGLGATEGQMQEVKGLLQEIGRLFKDPFDSAIGSIRSITSEFDALTTRTNLAAQGIYLSTKQLREYSRISDEIRAKAFASGVSDESKILSAIEKERNAYLLRAQAVNTIAAAEKEALAESKKNAEVQRRMYEENARMGDQMVAMFRKNEEQKQQALMRTQELIENINRKTELMKQGYSSSEATTFNNLKNQGVDEVTINRLIASSRAASEAAHRAVKDRADAERATKKMADANKYLIDLEARLAAQLDETNMEMKERHVNQLVKLRTQIDAAGLSSGEASKKFEHLDGMIRKVSAKERQEELRQLSRAMSVQMGDVAISLASGMNPLLVMIQQGDQIRGVLEQTNAKGKELQVAMQTAAAQIAQGFINTGKAIGGFFVGSIVSSGKAVADLAVKVFGLEASMATINGSLAAGAASGSMFSKVLLGISRVAVSVLGAAVLSVGASVLALAVGFFKAAKEQDNLAKSMALASGALGINTSGAYAYASAMNEAGYSTGKTLTVISAMGKAGNLFASEIGTVTKAALDLYKYGGVAIEDTVAQFSKLRDDPVDALTKIAKATGMVSSETIALVADLEAQGRGTEAAAVAMQEYTRVTTEQIKQMKDEYSSFGLFIVELGSSISKFFDDVFVSVFRKADPAKALEQQIIATQKLLEGTKGATGFLARAMGLDKLYESQLDQMKSQLDIMLLQTEAKKDQTKIDQQKREFESESRKLLDQNLSKQDAYARKQLALQNKIKEAEAVGANTSGFYEALRKNAQEYAKDLATTANKTEKLSDAENQRAKDMENLESMIERSNGLSGDFIDKQASLNRLLQDGKISLSTYTEVYSGYIAKQPFMLENIRKEEEARKRVVKAQREEAKELDAITRASVAALVENNELEESIRAESRELELQASMLALSTEERNKAIEAMKAQIEYEKRLRDIDNKEVDAGTKQFLKDEALKQLGLKLENIGKKFSNDLRSQLVTNVSDAIETALFEGGKAGRKKLRSLIVEELRKPISMTIKAFVDTVMSGGSGKSMENFTKKLDESITKLSDFLSGKTGEKFGSSVTNAMTKLGGSFGQYAATVGKAAGMLGNAMMGYDLAKTISGGYEANKYVNKIGAVASAVFGPIAGAIAGAVNRIFGRKLKDVGVQGTFGGDSDFSGSTYQYYKGGLLRSDKTKTGTLDSSVSSSLGAQFGALKDSTKAMATVLGLGSESIDNFTKSIKFSTKGMTPEEISAKFDEEFALLNDELAARVLGSARSTTENIVETIEDTFIDEMGNLQRINYKVNKVVTTDVAASGPDYAKAGETASQTLARLANSLFAVNSAFEDLGFILKETSLAGADAASKFVDFFGGIEAAQTAMQSYYENFYSEEERVAKTTQKLTSALAEMGVSMPTDREAYRKLVDEASAAGNDELVAGLIKLSDVFAELNPLVEEAESVIDEVAQRIADLVQEGRELSIELLEVQGKSEEAKIAMRALAIEGMTAAEIAAWDYNQSLRDQIAAIEKANEIATQTGDLNIRLAEAQGDEAKALALSREKELAAMMALDPSLAALLKQIFDAEDASTAAAKAAEELAEQQVEATRIAEEAAQAAEKLAEAWQDATDSIFEEINRIRGLSNDPAMNLQLAQQLFDSAISAANGGDVEAANALPALSQTLLELAGQQASSLVELRRIEAMTANALEKAAYGYVSQYGLTVPQFAEGGSYAGGMALVGEKGPELINFNSGGHVSTASSTARMMDNSDVVNELRSVRSELSMLRAEVRADVTHNAKTAKILDRAMRDGESLQVTVIT